jgi:hypothetical protein
VPSFKLVAVIVVVSAATFMGIEHYKTKKGA